MENTNQILNNIPLIPYSDICTNVVNSSQDFNRLISNCTGLNVMHINISGIVSNFENLLILIDQLEQKPQIMILSETQLILDTPFTIFGYNEYFIPPKNSTHDAIKIYVHPKSI